MVVCVIVYVTLLILFLFRKSEKLPELLKQKKLCRTMFLMNSIAFLLFISDVVSEDDSMFRNSYGGGSKTQEYRVSIEGELEEELVVVKVGALEYSKEEMQEIFENAMAELDQVVLGENESRNHVETKLNLVDSLEGYPLEIEWELEPFGILEADGTIVQEKIEKDGTILKATATLSNGANEAMYVMNFRIYPRTKGEAEKWLDEIEKSVTSLEESTRNQEEFCLPDTLDGKKVTWIRKEDSRGYSVVLLGFVFCALLVWKQKQDEKEMEQKRREQMMRDYPDILSKFTLLLGTGMTMKAAWEKIVENYEKEKVFCGKRAVYEEMCIACHEMNSGITESDSYERFGKRCGLVNYMKLGALLSQNLRKGSKGLADILTMESMQAFEVRKSEARRLGEEASAKLLLPMFAMLAVVMVIVIVPAFMSIQL